jgi:hypothetical protein
MSVSRSQTERGHEMPFVCQFSLFLPNRVGQLNELLGVLETEEVELAGLSVVDSSEWSVVRMIFTDPGKAREILRRHRTAFTECQVLAVVLEEPSTLGEVCKALVSAELNLHFAYPLLILREGHPVMVLHVDDFVLATGLLAKHGYTLIDHEDL